MSAKFKPMARVAIVAVALVSCSSLSLSSCSRCFSRSNRPNLIPSGIVQTFGRGCRWRAPDFIVLVSCSSSSSSLADVEVEVDADTFANANVTPSIRLDDTAGRMTLPLSISPCPICIRTSMGGEGFRTVAARDQYYY